MAGLTRSVVLLSAPLLGLGLLMGCSSEESSPAESAPPPSSSVAVPSASATVSETTVTLAEDGADTFFSLLLRDDTEGLAEFLSPGFQIARADGSTADKEAYLQNPADVGAYRLTDFFVTEAGDALVARYLVTATERIDTQLYSSDPRQRLSVFVRDGDTVTLLAHANLNTPENPTAEEPAETEPPANSVATSDPADVAIAEETQNAFFSALVDGDGEALEELLSPAFQLVRADGSSATKDQYLANPAVMDSFELTDFVTTREGDLIVARFLGATEETIDGQTYSNEPAPRFAVMQQEGDSWRIIAQVNFNRPES